MYSLRLFVSKKEIEKNVEKCSSAWENLIYIDEKCNVIL